MTTTARVALAAFLFAAFVAGTLAPGFASAHEYTREERRRWAENVTHNSFVFWYTGLHDLHTNGSRHRTYSGPIVEYIMNLYPSYGIPQEDNPAVNECMYFGLPPSQMEGYVRPAADRLPSYCRHSIVKATNLHPISPISYSIRFSGLSPDTEYTVYAWEIKRYKYSYTDVSNGIYIKRGQKYAVSGHPLRVVTAATGSEPETPEPETPTEPEPETPEPETPTESEPETPTEPEPETPIISETPGCTFEHRLIGVPGTAANAYNGQILVSSKIPNATATIRAYQADNGHQIDVLDAEGHAVENISLAPARSVKRFSIEAIRGWHPVIVAHPSKSSMNAATVAMRIREPGGSIEDSYPPGVEHCEPATDTGPVTETGTTAPDLAVRDAQALLWPATLDWRATVENIGDAIAQRTSVRLYYGERELAAQDVRSELAAGAQWPMSHGIARSGLSTVPRVGTRLRICVDPVPGEPESKRANNCANVTVESN